MKNFLAFLRGVLLIGGGITLAVFVLYLLAAKSMDFNFANEGKVVCVDHRDWGLFSRGDLKCFAVTPLNSGIDNLIQTVQNLDKNGEIILKK